MRKKCNGCNKVRKVKYRNTVDRTYFCSWDCMASYSKVVYLSRIPCLRCGNQVRMNAVVVRNTKNLDAFYCCEKCMMDDLGIVTEYDDDES